MATTARYSKSGVALDRASRIDPAHAAREGLRLLALWYSRYEQRRALAELGSEQLADIGVDRRQAVREAAKPFWQA